MGRTAGRRPEHVRVITVVVVHQRIPVPDALHPEGAQAVAPPDGADQGEPREPRRESDSGTAIFWLPSWPMNEPKSPSSPGTDFIRQVVKADAASARYGGRVITRFPPEPN